MDSAATTCLIGCILILSLRLTPFVGAAPDGAATALPTGAAPGASPTPPTGAAPSAAPTPPTGAAPASPTGAAPSAAPTPPTGAAPTQPTGAAPSAAPTPSTGAAPASPIGAAPSAAPTPPTGAAPTPPTGAAPASPTGAAPTQPTGAAPSAAPASPTGAAPTRPNGTAPGTPIVPCYYIFGDSLADSGNNNVLMTLAKANYPPYGVDYPGGPTGRFTNGRTYVDFIAEFLGFDHHMPPFPSAKGDLILQGVNYASAGAGIRPETGKICGDRIHLDGQLNNHRVTVSRIKELKGNDEAAAKDYMGKCLYTIGIGSNDYMNNYLLMPANPKDVVFTPETWANELVKGYSAFLHGLYDLGARKVALWGLGPIGCEPSQVKGLRMAGKQGCVETINQIISHYNKRIPSLVDEMNKLPGAKFAFVNSSHISPGNDPAKIGVKVSDKSCCKTTPVPGSCIRGTVPCPNRDEYSFFDEYHPTEKAVLAGVKRAYEALEPEDTYPMDVSHLARL